MPEATASSMKERSDLRNLTTSPSEYDFVSAPAASDMPRGGSRTVSRMTTASRTPGMPTTKKAARQSKNSTIQPPAR